MPKVSCSRRLRRKVRATSWHGPYTGFLSVVAFFFFRSAYVTTVTELAELANEEIVLLELFFSIKLKIVISMLDIYATVKVIN